MKSETYFRKINFLTDILNTKFFFTLYVIICERIEHIEMVRQIGLFFVPTNEKKKGEIFIKKDRNNQLLFPCLSWNLQRRKIIKKFLLSIFPPLLFHYMYSNASSHRRKQVVFSFYTVIQKRSSRKTFLIMWSQTRFSLLSFISSWR